MSTVADLIARLMTLPMDADVFFVEYRYCGGGDEYNEQGLAYAMTNNGIAICPQSDARCNIIDGATYRDLID